MKNFGLSVALCLGVVSGSSPSWAQDDAAATAGSFPLAAKQGVDSHADEIAPSGAVNQGPYDMKTWKYGHAFDALPNTPIWNPVKEKMMRGEKITSVTINGNADPDVYCAAANSGVDFIWTEMQHSGGTWDSVQKMWSHCPNAKAVPGVRIANANEFDEQHAMDLGALRNVHLHQMADNKNDPTGTPKGKIGGQSGHIISPRGPGKRQKNMPVVDLMP